jgi:hypothetical protein
MKRIRSHSLITLAALVALEFLFVLPDIVVAQEDITIRGRTRGWRGWGSSSFKYKQRGPAKHREYWRKQRAANMEDAERRRVQAAEDEFWRKEYRVPAALGTVNVRHLSEDAKRHLDERREEDKRRERERAEQARRAADAPPQKNVIEDAALNHVQAMSTYLGGLTEFTMGVQDTREEIKPGGPIQVRAEHAYHVTRPERLRLQSRGADGKVKKMKYNGKVFTIIQGEPSYEMEVPAEGSLDSLPRQLFASHRMVLPAGDLLHGNVHQLVTEDCSHARYVGLHYMQGKPCHHVVGTSAGVDWQLWIDSEGPPAPRRLLIRYRNQPGVPRYVASITELKPAATAP